MSKKKIRFLFLMLLLVAISVSIFVFFKMNDHVDNKEAEVFKAVTDGDSDGETFFFLYSHPFNGKSVVTSTKDGKNFYKDQYEISDVPFLQENKEKENEIFLFAEHDSLYYTLTPEKRLEEHNLKAPFTFFYQSEGVTVKSFNTDITDNHIEINDETFHKKYQLTLPSLLTSANADEEYIYIINYFAKEEKNVLHIIDREKGEKVKTIDLIESVSPDTAIEFFNDQLVVNTKEKLAFISKRTWEVDFIDYPADLSEPTGLYSAGDQQNLFVSFVDHKGNTGIATYDSKLKKTKEFHTNFPYTDSKFKDGRLYVSVQIEDQEKVGGRFGVFDIYTGEKLKEFTIPKEEVKVQDFLVIK